MCVEGLGMPFHKTPYKHGNLFITFKIKFPESLNENQIRNVQSILSSQAKTANQKKAINSVDKIEILVPFDETQKNTHAQGGRPEDHAEDDDDEEGGHQQVGCQAQ